jgi:hypothetical protein
MLRKRLAALGLAIGLGLACGCTYLANHPLMGCHGSTPCVGCEASSFPVTDGPVLEGYNPGVSPQPAIPSGAPVLGGPPGLNGDGGLTLQPSVPPPGLNGNGGLTLQPTVPPLSTPPRLVPQPQPQAPIEPYRP